MSRTTAETDDSSALAHRALALAAIAAVVATLGDIMMLYVANVGRPDFGLPPVPIAVLWIGGLLGVLAIPIYVLGYRAAAALVSLPFARHARVVSGAGGVGSVIGAVIHGRTATFIRDRVVAGAPARDPILAVGESPLLVVLWATAAVLVVTASIAFALAVRRGVPSVPRGLAWVNVASVTIMLAMAGAATPESRAFLVPAAPNVAHIVFFAACARAGECRGQTRESVFDSSLPS